MESFGCWVRLAILATAVGSVVSAQTDVQAENVNVHVVSGSVENAAKAAANMRFPSLVPNLFGAMLFDFSVNSKLLDRETNRPYEYTLRMPSDDNITIWNLAESSSITTFQILSHTANAFQTSLVGATVVVAVHVDGKGGNHLSITTIVPKAGTNVENELQKTLVAGLATTFLENMRLSVGVSNCNGEFALHSGICNNEGGRGSSGGPVRYSCPGEPKLDGSKITAGPDAPSPRLLSNAFCRADTQTQKPSTSKVNFLLIVFGQFLDHGLCGPSKLCTLLLYHNYPDSATSFWPIGNERDSNRAHLTSFFVEFNSPDRYHPDARGSQAYA